MYCGLSCHLWLIQPSFRWVATTNDAVCVAASAVSCLCRVPESTAPSLEAVHEPQLCHMFCEVIHYLHWKWQLKASNSTDLNLKWLLSVALCKFLCSCLVAKSNNFGISLPLSSFFLMYLACQCIIRTLCSWNKNWTAILSMKFYRLLKQRGTSLSFSF